MQNVSRLIAAAILVGLSATIALAQGSFDFGRTHTVSVSRNDRGHWQGTWYYANRDMRLALWLRDDDGSTSVRVHVTTTTSPSETFETDWSGAVDYNLQRGEGHFELQLSSTDANTITGTWNWELDLRDSARVENGRFTMYRGGDGRMLVMNFEEFERAYRRGTKVESYPSSHTMTFRKVSQRVVRWEEIPF